MYISIRVLVIAIVCGLHLPAHADTFYLTDFTFQSGATASGTVTIDTTLGVFTNEDITYTLGANSTFFTGVPYQGATSFVSVAELYNGAGDDFDMNFPNLSFIGYTGGLSCSITNPCFASDYGGFLGHPPFPAEDEVETGALSLTAPVPEPRSLVLLCTGLLGFIGVMRRRLYQM
ncbi:PEP-CTERM sorting domain-containing protein [Tunturiibacter lichenicola]|uniref:PEP-CTERM sorting domain-containing protein n=1 Tax=Tunturiibacter lichenicola TaxID=2051959 RepID=UPI0021B29DA3|nr:PEP-CTERM sorting domain-containing protein [Edaphobacter lichenicola]